MTSHDFFLLMLSLSQIKDVSFLIRLFVEALNMHFPGILFSFEGPGKISANSLLVSTIYQQYGFIVFDPQFYALKSEQQSFVKNLCQLLAVFIEKREQEILLESTNKLLKEQVVKQARDLEQMNEYSQIMNQEWKYQLRERSRVERERSFLFSHSLDLLVISGFDPYLKDVNPACTSLLGWSKKELLSKPWVEFVHPEDREKSRSSIEVLKKESSVNFEIRLISRNGEYRVLHWNCFSIVEESLVFGVGRDVTEKKRLEEKYHLSEKMHALGILAGGMAHDFNNQLMCIFAAADLLKEMLKKRFNSRNSFSFEGGNQNQQEMIVKENNIFKYLEDIISSAENSSQLVHKLLTFSRHEKPEIVIMDLHQIIMEVESLMKNGLTKKVRIKRNLSACTSKISGSPSQIRNAFVNLILNAKDSICSGSKKGHIFIETKEVVLESDFCEKSTFVLTSGRYIAVSIRDEGTGIPKQILPRIFEPFFTTKDSGKGTGMGLAVVYGTIKSHKGAIEVKSKEGIGSEFILYLPLCQEEENVYLKNVSSELANLSLFGESFN